MSDEEKTKKKKLYTGTVEIQFDVCVLAADADEAKKLIRENWRDEMIDCGIDPIFWHPHPLTSVGAWEGSSDDMPYSDDSNQKTIGEILAEEAATAAKEEA